MMNWQLCRLLVASYCSCPQHLRCQTKLVLTVDYCTVVPLKEAPRECTASVSFIHKLYMYKRAAPSRCWSRQATVIPHCAVAAAASRKRRNGITSGILARSVPAGDPRLRRRCCCCWCWCICPTCPKGAKCGRSRSAKCGLSRPRRQLRLRGEVAGQQRSCLARPGLRCQRRAQSRAQHPFSWASSRACRPAARRHASKLETKALSNTANHKAMKGFTSTRLECTVILICFQLCSQGWQAFAFAFAFAFPFALASHCTFFSVPCSWQSLGALFLGAMV